MSSPTRVHIALSSTPFWVGQTVIDFMIDTGGSGAPLVTPADNNGFPEIAELYARASERSTGIAGSPYGVISVTIRFVSAISSSASAIALNCYQADAVEYKYPTGF